MERLLKSIKVFNKITKVNWSFFHEVMNCVYFTPCENGTKWYFSDTRKVAYGELDIKINKPLLIPINELSKIKKLESFEFLNDGLIINDKKIKAFDGKYPDVEKVLNPTDSTEYTIKANFAELGTLFEALKYEVKMSVKAGEIRFNQSDQHFFSAKFEYSMPCEGGLPFEVLSGYEIYSLLAKEKINEIKVIDHKVVRDDKLEDYRYIAFETKFCKFFTCTYQI